MSGNFFQWLHRKAGQAGIVSKQFVNAIICLTLFALLASACQPSPAVAPTALSATAQPTTAPIPTNPPPTATVLPSAVPPHPQADPNATRIMLNDTTMQVSPGDIAPNATKQLVFGAAAGQTVTIHITTEPANSVILSVWGADGSVLLSEATKSSSWQGVVPSKQDYYIALRSVATQTIGYTFSLRIPPLTAPEATRVQFQANTTSWNTSGNLAAKAKARFVLLALQGQQMNVTLVTNPANSAFLYIWSADGTVYTLMAPTQKWSGILPLNQDYYIEVRSASTQASSYQLSVNIPSATGAQQTSAPTIRVDKPIRFATGPLDVTMDGTVISGERDRYKVDMIAGETLSVTLSSTESNAAFTILGPDQKPVAGTEEGKNIIQWWFTVPANGGYAILVGPTRGNATYKLNVKATTATVSGPTIRVDKRIRFATGPLDVTMDGAVISGERDRYKLDLIAGETLNVTISATESNATFSILGPDQKPVAGTEEGKDIKQWSLKVPSDGGYAILVGPTRGNATYKLVVKVK